jgi:hypothetical protein
VLARTRSALCSLSQKFDFPASLYVKNESAHLPVLAQPLPVEEKQFIASALNFFQQGVALEPGMPRMCGGEPGQIRAQVEHQISGIEEKLGLLRARECERPRWNREWNRRWVRRPGPGPAWVGWSEHRQDQERWRETVLRLSGGYTADHIAQLDALSGW